MFASFFVSKVDFKMGLPAESSTATLRSRLSCANSFSWDLVSRANRKLAQPCDGATSPPYYRERS